MYDYQTIVVALTDEFRLKNCQGKPNFIDLIRLLCGMAMLGVLCLLPSVACCVLKEKHIKYGNNATSGPFKKPSWQAPAGLMKIDATEEQRNVTGVRHCALPHSSNLSSAVLKVLVKYIRTKNTDMAIN